MPILPRRGPAVPAPPRAGQPLPAPAIRLPPTATEDVRTGEPADGTDGAVRILGLDPGSRVAGWGIVAVRGGARLSLIDHGVVRTERDAPLSDRLRRLFLEVSDLMERFSPDETAVESVFGAASIRSALTLGHARGAILAAAAGSPLFEYAPREIKKALTGYGDAGKGPVARMVAKRLRLAAPPEPEDASDALAAAICRADARRGEATLLRARRRASGAGAPA